mgnify:CR=1 FL=1|jgi:uncharacterized membrane protein YhaH (DUF805 family)
MEILSAFAQLGFFLCYGVPVIIAIISLFIFSFEEGNILSFKGRIGRMSSFLNSLIAYIIIGIGTVLALRIDSTIITMLCLIVIAFATLRSISVLIRRVHDFGVNGVVIPIFLAFNIIFGDYEIGHALGLFVNIIIWLIPGQKTENKYGDVPHGNFTI